MCESSFARTNAFKVVLFYDSKPTLEIAFLGAPGASPAPFLLLFFLNRLYPVLFYDSKPTLNIALLGVLAAFPAFLLASRLPFANVLLEAPVTFSRSPPETSSFNFAALFCALLGALVVFTACPACYALSCFKTVFSGLLGRFAASSACFARVRFVKPWTAPDSP